MRKFRFNEILIEICLYRFGTIQPICNGESWCKASCHNLAHSPFFFRLHFDLTQTKGSFHRVLNIWSLKILYSYIFLHYYYVQKKRESLAYISTFGIFWPKDICAQKYKKNRIICPTSNTNHRICVCCFCSFACYYKH